MEEETEDDITRINAKNAAGLAAEAMQYFNETGNRLPGFDPEENARLQKAYYNNPKGLYKEEQPASKSNAKDFWDSLVSNVKNIYSQPLSPVEPQSPMQEETFIKREIPYATPQENASANFMLDTSDKGAFESWEAYKKRKGLK